MYHIHHAMCLMWISYNWEPHGAHHSPHWTQILALIPGSTPAFVAYKYLQAQLFSWTASDTHTTHVPEILWSRHPQQQPLVPWWPRQSWDHLHCHSLSVQSLSYPHQFYCHQINTRIATCVWKGNPIEFKNMYERKIQPLGLMDCSWKGGLLSWNLHK